MSRRLFAASGHAIKFKPVIDQLETEFFGDETLQAFDVLVAEFDHAPGLQIDKMIVMRVRHFLVTRAAIAKIVALQNTGVLEQLHRAVDGGDGDVRIDRRSAAVEFLGVGMVFGLRQHARDHQALLGHAKALVRAKLLDSRHALVPILIRSGL
jgi:hypothetical protein